MNSEGRLNVLILPRWYPNRYDPMPGLFVKSQAEALSLHCNVTVLYVHPDPDCPSKKEFDLSFENGVRAIRVYYRPGNNRIRRWIRFYQAHMDGLGMIKGDLPGLIHVHVLTREGLMGYLIARRLRIPYVITEHWSRYFPENDFFRGFFKVRFTRFLVSRAAAVMAVSGKLKQAMIAKGIRHPEFFVVPNTVDTERFHLPAGPPSGEKKIVLHVSCFDDRSKNITGLLDAVRILARKRTDFVLHLAGDGPDLTRIREYASGLGLTEQTVVFTGLRSEGELAGDYGNACFTVLSSRFETFGTVIIESLACGTPVLATDTGIAAEVLNEANGLLVKPGDSEGLVNGLDAMLDRCNASDRTRVKKSLGDRYTPNNVAGRLMEIYRKVLDINDV